MTLNQIFTAPRFFNLLREETSSGYKMTFIVASVVFAFLLLIATIMASDRDMVEFHQIWYSIVLLGGGFYFTSISFNELNRKEERMNFLALPASTFEKFSLKLLMTTIGYVVGVTLLYWLFSAIAGKIAYSYFGHTFWEFNPFDDFYLFMIKIYVVIQSVFILGAATFNRFSFFKTLFTLWLIGVGLGLIGWILFRVVFAEYFDSFFIPKDNMQVLPDKNFQNFMEYTLWPMVQNVFWYVLAPFFWVVAFFKLKEREA